jgi:type IV pilus assembly protein PilX
MNTLSKPIPGRARKQRGVVLFFTLIALVVMSLAAVALIRSVDTSTLIGGNLAFKQSGTSSGDAGIEAAIDWLSKTTVTMDVAGKGVYRDADYALNIDGGIAGYTNADGTACCQNSGYFSNVGTSLRLTDGTFNWNANSTQVGTDISGNTVRYVIERLCRTANEIPATEEHPELVPPRSGCLFSSAALDNSGKQIQLAPNICKGPGCPSGGQTALMRITSRVTGPKNTVSYIQTVVY